MKLQGFSIVFALVAIPLILVLTYYIQLQVDTIALQNKYDGKLLDATRDAMSSFEINTANEDLSSVSDSLRTIIEASNNVFFNTLSTSLGYSNASKSFIEPYIPSVLYTLYDGYYISSPTRMPEILIDSDENAVAVGDEGVKLSGNVDGKNIYTYDSNSEDVITENVGEDYGQLLYLKKNSNSEYTTDVNEANLTTKNVLKTYMPYSARYKGNNFDITVVYTLDNYITINGTIGNVYYTKSGYLIPTKDSDEKDIIEIEVDDPSVNLLDYNQNDAENYIKEHHVKLTINDENSSPTVIEFNGNYNELNDQLIQFTNQLESAEEELIDNQLTNKLSATQVANAENTIKTSKENINNIQYDLNKMSAIIYYTKSTIFSNWVEENLHNSSVANVLENNLMQISGIEYETIRGTEEVIHDFEKSNLEVFDTTVTGGGDKEYAGVTEIPVNSSFYTHKLNVIRNSIQYNLNVAMSTYNTQTSKEYSYQMPVMQNEEWDRILSNPSIVSFMQGLPCKLKTYSNYMVVSSTNNEIAVSPKNIYYVLKNNFNDEQSEYHRIDCPDFLNILSNTPELERDCISFSSNEIKYDRILNTNNHYLYNHKNLACYNCINDGNYENVDIFDDTGDAAKAKLRQEYYLAVGKERNNLYKMNAIDNSHGYEIIYDSTISNNGAGIQSIDKSSSLPIEDIKQIEIVLGTIKTRNAKENLRYEYKVNNQVVTDVSPNSISSNETSNTTLILNLNPADFSGNNNSLNRNIITVTNLNEATSTVYSDTSATVDNNEIFHKAIKYIRVIYK